MNTSWILSNEPVLLDLRHWSDIRLSDVVLVNLLSKFWSTSDQRLRSKRTGSLPGCLKWKKSQWLKTRIFYKSGYYEDHGYWGLDNQGLAVLYYYDCLEISIFLPWRRQSYIIRVPCCPVPQTTHHLRISDAHNTLSGYLAGKTPFITTSQYYSTTIPPCIVDMRN